MFPLFVSKSSTQRQIFTRFTTGDFRTQNYRHVGECGLHSFDYNLCCTKEYCFNNVDDDGDGLVDCVDPDCRPLNFPATLGGLNCLGTTQTSDNCYDGSVVCDNGGPDFYCSEGDATTNICCQAGQRAEFDAFLGTWDCVASEPCYPTPLACGFDYATNFDNWRQSIVNDGTPLEWCMDPDNGQVCCEVVRFAGLGYYSDEDNVVVV